VSQSRILIIEDEAAIRDMLKFTLTASEYEVNEASNAEEGWKLALANKPDLILLDWMMPGTSGVALAQRLRQNDKTSDIPIIMLTARGEEVSRPFEDVMAEIRTLAEQGVREVNLLGQNVNAYRGEMADGEVADLAVLMHAVRTIPGIDHKLHRRDVGQQRNH